MVSIGSTKARTQPGVRPAPLSSLKMLLDNMVNYAKALAKKEFAPRKRQPMAIAA